ncbi:MAG: hypothetical protein ACRDGA_01245, partial [Bacteroidota bacterium]
VLSYFNLIVVILSNPLLVPRVTFSFSGFDTFLLVLQHENLFVVSISWAEALTGVWLRKLP